MQSLKWTWLTVCQVSVVENQHRLICMISEMLGKGRLSNAPPAQEGSHVVLPVRKAELGAGCWGGGSCWAEVVRAVAVCMRRAVGSIGRGVGLMSRQVRAAAGSEVLPEIGASWDTPTEWQPA